MGLIDLARQESRDELRALAEDIREGLLSEEHETRLRELVKNADDDEQARAFDENGAIGDLIAALDLPPPPSGMERFESDIDGEDVEIEIQDEPPERDMPPGLEGVPSPDQPRRSAPSSGERPDPRTGFGGQVVTRRFPQPQAREQFKKMETARLNLEDTQDENVPPGTFFDQFAEQVIGSHQVLTKEEFVQAEQSPDTTGLFK